MASAAEDVKRTPADCAAALDCSIDDINLMTMDERLEFVRGIGRWDLVALMVDGVHFGEHTCVVALGITLDGTKVPLGLVEGERRSRRTWYRVVPGSLESITSVLRRLGDRAWMPRQFDNPANPDVILAAMWDKLRFPDGREYGGPGSGVYRSTDGGESWSEAASQRLPPSLLDRCPSVPNC
mgnify:CR=1 FL=1